MMQFKEYIAKKFIGDQLRFRCDCIFSFDVVGKITDFEIVSNEIVFLVDVDGKIMRIGENHPNLTIENI